MSSSDGASTVYANLLLLEKLGYPLWYPDLDENLPAAYRDVGVRIGDVGSITGAGQFEFYFNVYDGNCAPPGFQPWQKLDTSFSSNMRPQGTVIKRGSVTNVSFRTEGSAAASAPIGGGIDFTCSDDKSAILVLPDGACCEDLKRPEKFLRLLTDDIVLEWLDFTESSSLLLVTGYAKSRSWGVAAVSNTSRQASVSLAFNALKVEGRFTGSYSWTNTSDGHHRVGPQILTENYNQCIFLRGYRMSSRRSLTFFRKFKARITDISGSKMHEPRGGKEGGRSTFRDNQGSENRTSLGSREGRGALADAGELKFEDDEVFIEALTDIAETCHPSDVINAYLLENFPDVQVAVTHDYDWCAVIEDADKDFLIEEFLRRVHQKYEPISESGLVRLIPLAANYSLQPDNYLRSIYHLNQSLTWRQRKTQLHVQQGECEPTIHNAQDVPRLDGEVNLMDDDRVFADVASYPLLRIAAEDGYQEVVRLILARNYVELNLEDMRGRSPLSFAAENGHEDVVKLILARPDVEVNSKDTDGRSSLSFAAGNGREKVVNLLLAQHDVDINSKDVCSRSPLSFAAGNGHVKVVELFLTRDDVDVNSKNEEGYSPLSLATQNGHEVVKLLMARHDVDVNSKDVYGRSPLSFAAAIGLEQVAKLLLRRGEIEVDLKEEEGHSPLSLAAEYGREEVTRLLLTRDDVKVDLKDEDGCSPLSLAAQNGREKVVKLLVERRDVDVNSKDKNGYSPLWFAAKFRHIEVMVLLLGRDDIKVNWESSDHSPPPFPTAVGREEMVRLLLAQHDVDVDKNSRSPLVPTGKLQRSTDKGKTGGEQEVRSQKFRDTGKGEAGKGHIPANFETLRRREKKYKSIDLQEGEAGLNAEVESD